MAAANRHLEEEFDALKAGLDTLRNDISSRVNSFGDAATTKSGATCPRRCGAGDRPGRGCCAECRAGLMQKPRRHSNN